MSDGICRDYFESAENCAITRKRALYELEKHSLSAFEDISDFYRDLGELDIYRAQDVLRWLGY
ncbi:hypothetical protein BL250_12510 [Erwinia sp. OLTSP20]|nr:hypothetical protein BV501_13005 [Erwinia sp. OAMSP11]PIJ69746.1 hypothetical protein BK416_13830 [Erwinia sp. OLSSP12]PIJ76230.1 hypothetical protein BLD47_18085 [Erwinia sp. OLCASP19]PIJ76751.1 hypothetical protein BLD46_18310 [Erwinia sp. OLMTSP26]PIJ78939.1 hypothetical protein BLD49_17640 [Erwinia sp. OLMDSP33]PIJ89356.1 hypothetical protein BL249_16575 [Erwinia sp. OLFS4]PIJ91363.1 hypothetical protein BL250_12510 [Erwinia sp. OLTSP20]